MQRQPGGRDWRVGYVGESLPLGTGQTVCDDAQGYEVQRLECGDLPEPSVHVLVVDAERLDDVAERIDPEQCAVVTVGPTDEVCVSAETLAVLEDHVAVTEDDLAPLDDALETILTDRWRNLGMPPEQFLDAIFDRTPAHLYVKDAGGRHVRASRFYDGPDQLVGLTDWEAYPHKSFGMQAYSDDMTVIRTGNPIIEKEEFNPGDDSWMITSKMPVTDSSDEIVGLVGFTHLITTRKKYERALERQNKRLEQFAEILSHDLRNPLSVAHGDLQLAREAHPEDEHLERIGESLDRIDELVDDVLTLTRGGQRVVNAEPVSLESVCESCWDVVSTATAELLIDDVEIMADPGRLRHVFENLFRNAVEHGGDDVTVEIGPLADRDGFYVADDGRGIPADEREQIFERGFTTASDGTGIGLEIVRQIVDAHDWDVDVVESDSGGTRFEFSDVDLAS